MPSSSRSYYHHPPPQYEYTQYEPSIPLTTVLTCVVAGLCLIYHLLADFLALPSPLDAIALMAGLLFGPAAREHLQNTFATSPRQVVSQVRNRAASMVGRAAASVDGGTVGGLWNVGNTCYQNSVLQALASLGSLKSWLDAIQDGTAADALHHLVEELNAISDKPRVETASALITQASGGTRGWMFNEQQDAQEFLQGLMGVLEKEVAAVVEKKKGEKVVGLEGILGEKKVATVLEEANLRSPFEGLLAQRVGCLDCGYVESISLQPFTTLSLPIPSTWATTLEDCLRAFTSIEKIPGVDCDKCTLWSVQERLSNLLNPPRASAASSDEAGAEDPLPLPDALRETIATRLAAVTTALEDDNFTPRIPGVKLDGAHKVSSTKTKQVMIARAPQVLVLHTNRSQFDMLTGMVGKNYAAVKFPAILDLAQLGVVTRHEHLSTDPGGPISIFDQDEEAEEAKTNEGIYELKAVVAHYGGHHNGHYVAYRSWADRWWRISDHEVIPCIEEDALAASNAFMLFYERITPAALLLRRQRESAIPSQAALLSPLPDSDEESVSEWDDREWASDSGAIPITPQQLPTPPDSESETETEVEAEAAPVLMGTKQKQEQTPPPEGPMDINNDDIDDVPELTRAVSSRDSSPETPPPSIMIGRGKKRKGKRRARKVGTTAAA
ncbi:hypothetical protein BDD12DRAFT_979648 [Trichophaea hybrida]|nr:hypothetical protein BDD12DRAFT_979648 [Trichophaea hybrida]